MIARISSGTVLRTIDIDEMCGVGASQPSDESARNPRSVGQSNSVFVEENVS